MRLRALSDRYGGARACSCAASPCRRPTAPSSATPAWTRTWSARPVEAAILDRLLHGGFASSDRLGDALLVAVVETGVPVYALDAERLDGPAGAAHGRRGGADRRGPDRGGRGAGEHRRGGRRARGRLAVRRAGRAVRRRRADAVVRLYAPSVEGVPAIHVEEALFTVADALAEG